MSSSKPHWALPTALERELGGGGMARVFVATEAALGREIVVKLLPPELAVDVSVERFNAKSSSRHR